MKRMSIRARMTIWYTVVLMLLLYAGYGGAYGIVRNILIEQNDESIVRSAAIIANSVQIKHGRTVIELDRNDSDILSAGILYALYDRSGAFSGGSDTEGLERFDEEFNHVRLVNFRDDKWLLYDKAAYYDGIYAGRVRVMLSVEASFDAMETLRNMFAFSVIPSLLFSILGGFIITGRALKPLRGMAKTALEIGAGDLTKRIAVPPSRDEVGELAAAFNEMTDSLERAFRREKRFSSDASHEMRTPLAVIIANAEDAKRSDDIETFRQSNDVILAKGRRLQQMISQLLTLAREHEQARTMTLDRLNLRSVMKDIADEAAVWAGAKNITIKSDVADGLIIDADLMLFTRMAVNILNNAVKYGREGGVIEITGEKSGKNALLSIKDDGCGIAEKDLPHIFERFYRADESRTGEGSAGLGLSFVEMIVKLHHWKIAADSKQGEGTRFTVTIPLAVQEK